MLQISAVKRNGKNRNNFGPSIKRLTKTPQSGHLAVWKILSHLQQNNNKPWKTKKEIKQWHLIFKAKRI